MKRICLRDSTKPLPNDAIGLLPVDVRRSKTRLLKFPNKINRVNFSREKNKTKQNKTKRKK